MGLTGHAGWRLGPPEAGIVHAMNAYCYRCPFGLEYPSCEVNCAQRYGGNDPHQHVGTHRRLLAEPIQGVGGFITPPKEYFAIVSDIVKKYGGVFIGDEVQTGMGTHGRQMVRHRALGRCARYHHQREGPGQRPAGRRDHRAP